MARFKAPNSGFHHLFHLHMDVELLEVGIFQLFRNLGKGMLTLALPFYLYSTLGYEIWQICLFYAVWQLSFVIIHPFAGSFLGRWGLKHCMAIMALTSSVFWLALPYLLQTDFWSSLLWMIPFFAIRTFGLVLFEIAYDIFLTHHMNREARGQVLAWLQISVLLAALLSPILGAWLTTYFGLQAATWGAVGFFIIAGAVLLLTPDEKIKVPYTPKTLAFDTFKKTPKALYISQAGWVFQDSVLWVIWPIFLALVLPDLLSMSLLVGVASFLAMIVAYFMGKTIDRKAATPKALLREASIRGTVVNVCRAISFSPVIIFMIDFMYKINWQSISVPHDAEVFKWLHEKDTYERSHIRWWIIETMYLPPLIVAGLLFYFIPGEPQWLFILLFLASGLMMMGTMQAAKLNQKNQETNTK